MKKIYYLLPLIAVLVAACGGSLDNKEYKYTLTGKFMDNNENGKAIYLQSFDNESGKLQPIDTVEVVDGAFTFTGKADSTAILYITSKGLAHPHMFVPEVGAIEMNFDSSMVSILKGTSLNEKYQGYVDKKKALDDKRKNISRQSELAAQDGKMTAELEQDLDAKAESLYKEINSYTFDFVKSNIANPIGQFVFLDRGRSFDQSQLGEIVPLVSENVKTNPKFKKIENRFQALQTTAVGKKFTDLKSQTTDGKDIALSDYAGKDKYVLVDFWASWCPPCRKEMPELVKIYNQYKSKGFEIVGVSLDSKLENWEKGIKDLKITWPQMSDLKYWDTELGAAYAVNSIPHMVLLDKDGTIIAKGINAQELSEKLAELLN